MDRRAFLGLSLATLAASRLVRAGIVAGNPDAGAPLSQDLEIRDLHVDGDRAIARRFVMCVPKHLAPGERVPLLVLLHGLAETVDERLGAFAWLEKYGLGTAYDRLRRAPVLRTSTRGDFTSTRLTEVNASLAAQPFRGLAIACPFTPNVNKAANTNTAIDGFTRWIEDVLLPRARAEAPVIADAAHTSIDGCSLGGWIGLEVFLRRPRLFGAWGGVQSAISVGSAPSYADRIAQAIATTGPRPLHIESSSQDPFRAANEALAAALNKKAIAHELRVPPGPHDQPWLREAGTIEMLLWHDQLTR